MPCLVAPTQVFRSGRVGVGRQVFPTRVLENIMKLMFIVGTCFVIDERKNASRPEIPG